MAAIRILLVEDESLVAAMLSSWLADIRDFEVVGHARDAATGLKLCLEKKPDIAILDIQLPDTDGLVLAEWLAEAIPSTNIMVLSSRCDPNTVHRISTLGIPGYVDKSSTPDVLETAIRAVAGGEHFFSEAFMAVKRTQLSRADAFHKLLTRQQLLVLGMVAHGLTDEEIADRLNLARATVSTHRKHLRAKLDAHNDRDLIRYAREWGLVSDGVAPDA